MSLSQLDVLADEVLSAAAAIPTEQKAPPSALLGTIWPIFVIALGFVASLSWTAVLAWLTLRVAWLIL